MPVVVRRHALFGLTIAAIMSTGCANHVGLAGDESPLTGWTRSVQPIPAQPSWRRTLFSASLAAEARKQLSQVAYSVELDRLTVGNHDGDLFCFRASDGVLQWRKRIGGDARVAFHEDQMFVGTSDGQLTMIDVDSGLEDWTYKVKGAIDQPPLIAGSMVIFVDGTNAIYALDRATGEWKWQYRRELPAEFALAGEARPGFDGERIYMGFSDGFLVALAIADGAVVWTRDLAPDHDRFQDVDAEPLLIGGVLFAASASGGLYALNPVNGDVRWKQPIEGIVAMSAVDTDLLASLDRGVVMRISGASGRTRWRARFGKSDGAGSQPVRVGDNIAIAFSQGGLYFLDGLSGRPIQHFDPGTGIHSPPASGPDGSVFMVSNGGVLYAWRPRARR